MNRSLPDIPRLTILDMYILSSCVFNCLVIVWHSVSHVYLTNGYPPAPEKDTAFTLDKWFLGIFAVLFVVMNMLFAVKLWYAYAKIKKLRDEELKYLEKNKEFFFSLTH